MKNQISKSVAEILDTVDSTVDFVEKEMSSIAKPVQKSVFARFPILFSLLVTFGVSTTFLALERIVIEMAYVYERPLIMLAIGLCTLTLTGTLYKKLG